VNVGPRDGLQNELTVLEPETRAELVNRLASAGLRRIEVTSFVSAARVPQMADAEAVVQGVVPNAAIEYAGLVLNGRGCERLRATGVDRVHFALAVTETFNRRSAGASVADSLAAATEILGRARGDGLGSTVTLAVAFGCPFEGRVDSGRVLDAHTVAFLRQAGCDVEHLRLGEHGVHGNGHLMMLEKNNREALQPILDWLESKEA